MNYENFKMMYRGPVIRNKGIMEKLGGNGKVGIFSTKVKSFCYKLTCGRDCCIRVFQSPTQICRAQWLREWPHQKM